MVEGETRFRRFELVRGEDVSGVSGTGRVAQGVEFFSGRVVLCWLREPSALGVYASIGDCLTVHGHGGCTVVRWIDPQLA